jgi:hypothetical protein
MHAEEGKMTESLKMNMLLEALPKESATDPTGKRLAKLITSISNKKAPVNTFARIWILGSLQAKVTAGYFAYWLRSRFVDADKKQRLKSAAHLNAALQLFGAMGYLRGAVMKVGQMLANLPEVVPEEFAEVFLLYTSRPLPCTSPWCVRSFLTSSVASRRRCSRTSTGRPLPPPLWGRCTAPGCTAARKWR